MLLQGIRRQRKLRARKWCKLRFVPFFFFSSWSKHIYFDYMFPLAASMLWPLMPPRNIRRAENPKIPSVDRCESAHDSSTLCKMYTRFRSPPIRRSFEKCSAADFKWFWAGAMSLGDFSISGLTLAWGVLFTFPICSPMCKRSFIPRTPACGSFSARVCATKCIQMQVEGYHASFTTNKTNVGTTRTASCGRTASTIDNFSLKLWEQEKTVSRHHFSETTFIDRS